MSELDPLQSAPSYEELRLLWPEEIDLMYLAAAVLDETVTVEALANGSRAERREAARVYRDYHAQNPPCNEPLRWKERRARGWQKRGGQVVRIAISAQPGEGVESIRTGFNRTYQHLLNPLRRVPEQTYQGYA